MIQNRSRLLVLTFSLLLTGEVSALACDAVFSNAVGTTDGKLELKDNAMLQNTGDRELATGELKTKAGADHCDSQACVQSGIDAPTLTIPPHNTKTDFKDQSFTFAPGDYYYEDFELIHSNTITISGPGQVRIHVRKKLKIEDQALVNVDGNPLDLIFLVADKVEITDDAQVNAIIYAKKEIKVKDDAVVVGALVGTKAKIEDNASVTYTATEDLEIPGICELGSILLDHIRMTHDGIGVVGLPETVNLIACANADCSQIFTGSVTVDLLPVDGNTSWSGTGVSGNQVTFSGGTQTVNLDRTLEGTFNIGSMAIPAALNPTRCFIGAAESCEIMFPATVFVVTLPDQMSGGPSVGTVSLPSCWPDFQSTTVAVDVRAQYVSPLWAGPALIANGVSLPTDGSAAVVDLVFDASCVAPLQVTYMDAGEIGIDVGFVGSGSLSGLTISGADNLVFYPAGLRVQIHNASAVALDASAPGALPVHPAGAGFELTVTALNSSGGVTRGYQPQAVDRLLAYAQRTGPTSGFEGIFKLSSSGDVPTQLGPPSGVADYTVGNIAPGDFVDGVFRNTAASYSEVGLWTLYLQDRDYFGHTITASSVPVGRFIPAGFQLSPLILNRVGTVGCAGGGFTYMGEELRVSAQLIAKNASGGITRNYQGSFAAFDGSGFGAYAGLPGNTLGVRAGGSDLSGRLMLHGVALAVPWAAGVTTLNTDLSLQPIGAVDGPFDGAVLGMAFSDSDGAVLLGLDLDVDGSGSVDHLNLGSTDFRAGRLSVGNAHGSELRDLDIPLAMQFYAGPGQGFVTHSLDDCSPIAAVVLSDADTADPLLVADTCIVDQLGASGPHACAPGTAGRQYSATPTAGVYALSLKSPGAGKTGGLRVSTDTPAWAEFDWTGVGATDPAGIATFGIYNRETELIYQREIR